MKNHILKWATLATEIAAHGLMGMKGIITNLFSPGVISIDEESGHGDEVLGQGRSWQGG